MKSLEFEGKTIDEAIEKACNEFQVPREKLNIEIISEGTIGFLGFVGGKKAKIKACLVSLDEALTTPLKGHSFYKQPPIPVDSPDKSSKAPSGTQEADENLAERAKRILEGSLSRMHIDLPVNVSETSDKVILNIEGDGGGLLIGKGGQTLDALQYIVNKAVHKSGNGRKMIIVNTESYRERREASLVALAAKIGEKVKKTKKAVVLNHLNAHNRRIIHMALQNDTSITTKSRGEGEYRKIIVLPVKKE
jgi:spoIIIJ-associated protein